MFQHIWREYAACLGGRFAPTFIFLGALSLAAGCSDDSTPGTPAGSGGAGGATTGTGGTGGGGGSGDKDGSTDCMLFPDVDTYVANMSKPGKNNLMSFKVVESTPAPPAKTDNAFKVQVTTTGGMAVTEGLKVRVWMPSHGHDSPIPPGVTYDPMTSTYTIKPVSTKVMPGVWRVSLRIADAMDEQISVDLADFNFCIP
jgi:hypothetical protein